MSAEVAMLSSSAPSSNGKSFERLLFDALFAERRLLGKLGVLSLTGAVLGLAPPQLARMAIDQALPTSSPRLLLALSLAALLLGAHQAWAGWLEDGAATALSACVEQRSLEALFSALLAADSRALGARNPGWTSDTASGASDAARGYVSMCVGAVTQGCLALAFFVFLLSCSPLAALLVTVACGALTALSWWFVRWEARLAQCSLDAQSHQQELLHTFLSSLAALRGLCCGERSSGRWRAALGRAALASTARVRAATLRSLTLSGIQRVVGLGVTTWAVLRCVSSELGVGEMFLVTGLAAGLSGSLLALSGAWLGFRALAPQFARLNLVLGAARLSDVPSSPPECSAASETEDRLLVEGLSFRYREGERWILKDHAFELRRGELCRLDSPSGSGKSTFLKLMAGLLTPTRGQIRVFGLNPRNARQLVLYVPQHCSLLEASIGENLRLLSGASDLEIARVARLTGLSELLAELPMGLETPVAAQGQNFSSGQRQLIVLSAAFASARPVLLLDESMSQIDLGTRRRMDFPALIQNRTVILVEHQQ